MRQEVPKELLGHACFPRLIRYSLTEWAVIVAVWVTMTFVRERWLYPVWLAILAGRFHALGVLLHDAVHMPFRRKRLAARALEILAGYPVGSTIEAMRYHHLRHHRNNGMPGDPYFKTSLPKDRLGLWLYSLRYLMLAPFWIVRGLYGTVAAFAPALRSSYARVFLQDRSGMHLDSEPEVMACAREEPWQVLFHSGVVALAVRDPQWFLFSVVGPLMAAGFLVGRRLLTEHTYEPCSDRSTETTIRSTNDHHLGLAGHLFLAPRNVGYHRMHHLHPQVALENLPRLKEWYNSQQERVESFPEEPTPSWPSG